MFLLAPFHEFEHYVCLISRKSMLLCINYCQKLTNSHIQNSCYALASQHPFCFPPPAMAVDSFTLFLVLPFSKKAK